MGLKRKPVPPGPPAEARSLAEALAGLPEARRPYGWSPGRSPLPLAGMLQVAVAAMLCGARSLYAVAQWAHERVEEDAGALVPLGLPAGRSPSVATLHRVFKRLDVAAFEAALGAWLERTGVQRVSALAIDGKTLRGIHGDEVPGVHLVAAYAHEAGTVLAQVAALNVGLLAQTSWSDAIRSSFIAIRDAPSRNAQDSRSAPPASIVTMSADRPLRRCLQAPNVA